MLLRPDLIALLLACAFFAVLFLQSGLDKVFDRSGNLAWLEPHFAKSPLRGQVPLMLSLLTILEIGSGVVCAVSVASVLAGGPSWMPVVGIGLAALSLLCLFAGQRIAKDYAGAAVLAAYFAVALLGLILAPAAEVR